MIGRRRTPGQWRELVHGWSRSGLTQAEYCDRHGVSVTSLHRWREHLRGEADSGEPRRPAGEPESVHLLPVQLSQRTSQPGPETDVALTLVFRDGLRLEIAASCDLGLLGQVIEVLRESAAP